MISHLSRWQKSALLIFCGLSSLIILTGSLVFLLCPGCEDYLRKEDCLIENITVAVYILTFLTSLFLLRKRPADKVMLTTLCILASIATLEELSYGQRIFGYEAIATFYNEPFDSMHDLFKVGFLTLRNYFHPHKWAAALFLTCCGLLAVFLKIRLNLHVPSSISPRRYTTVYLAGLAGLCMLVCALLIDLARFDYLYLFVLEELFELNGSIALLTATLCAKSTKPDRSVISDA